MNDAITESTETVLKKWELSAETRHPWVHVGKTSLREGWKIHISCRPSELGRLAGHLAAAHGNTEVPFKVVATVHLAELLNEGGFGQTQIGKCATVYPRDQAEFAQLVAYFAKIKDLHGPRIPDDIRLGNAVFARFGGFNPDVERDLLGQAHLKIQDLDGQVVRDDYGLPLVHRRFARCFGKSPWKEKFCVWPDATLPQSGEILNDRYLIVDVLRDSVKGPLFQAIDISHQQNVRPMIIKMGRAQVLSDRFDRDIRSRLQAQARWHGMTSKLGLAPACDPYFEVEGDGFLPIEFMPGDNLEARVQIYLGGRTLDFATHEVRSQLLAILCELCNKLNTLHSLDLVHRDLSPSNILLEADDTPMLSDLEIAAPVGTQRLFGKGTPGFMAPEQAAGGMADPRADVRSFAAIVLYCLTGLDPRRLPMSARGELIEVRPLAKSVSPSIWDMVEAGLALTPAERPTLNEFLTCLDSANGKQSEVPKPAERSKTRQVAMAALSSIACPALVLADPPLWFSAPVGPGQSENAQPELRRSLNRGSAGPLLLAARHNQWISKNPELLAVCQRTANWLISNHDAPDAGMPGLHFGEAGVLLSLFAARDAGLVSFDDDDVAHLWTLAFDVDPHWPDITHGAAGQLLALQALRPHKADIARMTQLVDYLLSLQHPEGFWVLPDGVEGLSGQTVTGFAHGVAGIAYALAVTGGEAGLEAARRAACWLVSVANRDSNDGLSWHYSDQNKDRWIWWCHGAPGIATLFVALFQLTQDQRWQSHVADCFSMFQPGVNPGNLSLCHGAAGIGELMLDAAIFAELPDLHLRAQDIAELIVARRGFGTKDVWWVVENTELVSADLMVGMGGVVDFLLRMTNAQAGKILFPTHVVPAP